MCSILKIRCPGYWERPGSALSGQINTLNETMPGKKYIFIVYFLYKNHRPMLWTNVCLHHASKSRLASIKYQVTSAPVRMAPRESTVKTVQFTIVVYSTMLHISF